MSHKLTLIGILSNIYTSFNNTSDCKCCYKFKSGVHKGETCNKSKKLSHTYAISYDITRINNAVKEKVNSANDLMNMLMKTPDIKYKYLCQQHDKLILSHNVYCTLAGLNTFGDAIIALNNKIDQYLVKKAPKEPKAPKAPKEPKAPKVPKAPKAPKVPKAQIIPDTVPVLTESSCGAIKKSGEPCVYKKAPGCTTCKIHAPK
jgi:hypothetical protein